MNFLGDERQEETPVAQARFPAVFSPGESLTTLQWDSGGGVSTFIFSAEIWNPRSPLLFRDRCPGSFVLLAHAVWNLPLFFDLFFSFKKKKSHFWLQYPKKRQQCCQSYLLISEIKKTKYSGKCLILCRLGWMRLLESNNVLKHMEQYLCCVHMWWLLML